MSGREDTTHVLILDEVGTPSISNAVSYSSFLSLSDNVELLVITSKGALSQGDKDKCLAYEEIATPTTNGLLEVLALRLHDKYRIDKIYTKQEDLILRASLLRDTLGIKSGLSHSSALLYRDKELMKRHIAASGFPVPPYARIYSPASILSFLRDNPFPIIIKPTLGSASAGVTVVRSQTELEAYLEKEFYTRIDDGGKCMDYSGDMIVEGFVNGNMFHVNGHAHDGHLEDVWPFSYVKTNLGFTTGQAYGNVLIPQGDPMWKKLIDATERVLAALPAVDDLVFHLELFNVVNDGKPDQLVLCEIAARRPGGSIGMLINASEGGAISSSSPRAATTTIGVSPANPLTLFSEMEFRLSLGLALRQNRSHSSLIERYKNFTIGDLLIPRKVGQLQSIPEATSCPLANTHYFPIAKVGTTYTGFHMTTMNTAARFVVLLEDGSVAKMEEALANAQAWFENAVVYEAPSLPVLKPSHIAKPESQVQASLLPSSPRLWTDRALAQ
ncbi:hypothetical protein PhCBS80983_g01129 [Powellomyces hirtus]|uniref:ATP-grasp domain-containing protein n=1 Tax=Powellomyces hirtus TaxID=109895 RepID=A0A507ECP4_9FUNG|nr:hypothetical protein PhCBS80983_g01129 [Powellomyces hirtus]